MIDIKLQSRFLDIPVSYISTKIQFDLHFRRCFLLLLRLALQYPDSSLQQLAVQVKAYIQHMPVLLGPQKVAGTPDLQIPHSQLKTGAKLGEFPDGVQPFLCHIPQDSPVVISKVGVSNAAGPSHPAPELVQLG